MKILILGLPAEIQDELLAIGIEADLRHGFAKRRSMRSERFEVSLLPYPRINSSQQVQIAQIFCSGTPEEFTRQQISQIIVDNIRVIAELRGTDVSLDPDVCTIQ